ncbi:MAG: AmmeMemoRadiSam system protein B [Candidatus Falkowbacteria bacterium]
MPIIFSAIAPHPPILIPSIGKKNLKQIESTSKAMKKLEEDLYVAKPDTILIISPHGPIQPDAFTMNLNPEFNGDFEEFGDMATKMHFKGDIGLAYRIRERMETRAPMQLISEPDLDHGCLVPLHLLTEHIKKVKIIPIYFSGLDLNAHFNFGKLLKRELVYNQDRVAVIASGDLSHRLTKDAPAGYSPKGKKFDKKLIDLLLKKEPEEIINMDIHLIHDAGECGLKPISILLGIMNGIDYEPQLISYEGPFGVGYMVMKFKF